MPRFSGSKNILIPAKHKHFQKNPSVMLLFCLMELYYTVQGLQYLGFRKKLAFFTFEIILRRTLTIT